jgi:hypothetical protein
MRRITLLKSKSGAPSSNASGYYTVLPSSDIYVFSDIAARKHHDLATSGLKQSVQV